MTPLASLTNPVPTAAGPESSFGSCSAPGQPPPAPTAVDPSRSPAPPGRSANDRLNRDAGAERPVARRGELTVTLGLRHAGPRRVLLRWETVGADHLPAVAVLGGISANRHVAATATFPQPGWWDEQLAAGRPLDPHFCRVLSLDWVGADGSLDVPLDTSDQADALASVLDHLRIARLAAIVGCSYGALVGLQLAVRYRRRVGHLVAISGGARPAPYAAAYRSLQRQVVALGEQLGRPTDALALARQLGMLSYRSPAEFAGRFSERTLLREGVARCAAQDYLEACGRRYVERWSPIAFSRLSESIDLHAVDPAAVRVPCTFAAVAGDWLAPADQMAALTQAVDAPAAFHLIESIFGHDAFLKEPEQIATILGAPLESITRAVTA